MVKVVLLFCVLSLCALYAYEVDFSNIEKRGSIYYEKSSKKPFSGVALKYYKNGLLWHKTTFKNGYKDGEFLAYWSNGNLQYRGYYEDGKLHGVYEQWWDNRQQKARLVYRYGRVVDRN